ncbi:MAG TPA: MFS transporter [Mycobacteriales bacterium]|nr:MFS transporter [Mycobacteriales bacterium]
MRRHASGDFAPGRGHRGVPRYGPLTRQILVLGGVLGLSGADIGTVSAAAVALKSDLGIGNTEIGALVTATTLAGAVLAVPAGVLVDRCNRTRLLALSIVAWMAAILLTGGAPSYLWLLGGRVVLGAVTATAGPAVASLVGDLVPVGERARIYGMVLAGELLGTGAGYAISVNIASALSWRFAFWWLVIPSAALAALTWRMPEPVRGTQSRVDSAPSSAQRLALSEGRRSRYPQDDPRSLSTLDSVRYVLSIRSNVIIVAASALGYFFFAGLRTFAIVFATDQFGVGRSTASFLVLLVGAGAIGGVFFGGRAADFLLHRGMVRARVLVASICLLLVSPIVGAGLSLRTVGPSLLFLTAGAFCLGAVNPALDAARLDVVPAPLWGRAEGVRTVPRELAEALAPTAFGWVSDHQFAGATAMGHTFLVFLGALAVAGLLGLLSLRTYPGDAASAARADTGGRD